jgi:hypothetical protein
LFYVIPFWNADFNITDLIVDIEVGVKPAANNVNWELELTAKEFDLNLD